MRRLLLAIVLWSVALPISAQAQAPASICAGTKDECQQKEIIELRQQLAQAQIQLVQLQLQAQWATLEHDVRVRLHAKTDDEIDLTTLTIKPKPAPSDAGPQVPAKKD